MSSLTNDLGQQRAIFGEILKIGAAAQLQLLLQAPFELAMGALEDSDLVGKAAVAAARRQAVVAVQGLVARCDVVGVAAIVVAAGG